MKSQRPSATEPVLSVIEERLEIGRQVKDTGRTLRVRKQVLDVPVDVREPVLTERFGVERVAIGRVITTPADVRHEGDTWVIPVVEERLVTRKELVLVEEIRISRHIEVRQVREQVHLRREQVWVERFDPDTQQWLPEGDA